MRSPVLAAALVLGVLAASCSEMDEAVLVDPGTERIEADVDELRVLRHRDDPTAGDEWLDVLEPDPGVVEATDRFRQEDSRHADDDEPADVRMLYEGVAPGRTVLVQLNCRECEDGVPSTDVDATEVLVWDFVVGEPDAGAAPTLGPSAAATDGVHSVEVGQHLVVVRQPDETGRIEEVDGRVLRLLARHLPEDGARLLVDVFAAVGPGDATLAYADDEYAVRVS